MTTNKQEDLTMIRIEHLMEIRSLMPDMLAGYIETALWSSTDNSDESGGQPLDRNFSSSDISPASLLSMEFDCRQFLHECLEEFGDFASIGIYAGREHSAAWMFGHNFSLNRNGHGTGFWDAEYDVPSPIESDRRGRKLSDMCKPYGTSDLMPCDDMLELAVYNEHNFLSAVKTAGTHERAFAIEQGFVAPRGIVIDRIYEIITEESVQQGDAAERGFDYETREVSFRELVIMLRDYPHASCSPIGEIGEIADGGYIPWVSSESTLEEPGYSLHFSRHNRPGRARFWAKALRLAGHK